MGGERSPSMFSWSRRRRSSAIGSGIILSVCELLHGEETNRAWKTSSRQPNVVAVLAFLNGGDSP